MQVFLLFIIFSFYYCASVSASVSFRVQNASAAFTARVGAGISLFNGAIVLTGRYDTGSRNDVWRSEDYGVTWQLKTSAAAFPACFYHSQATFIDPITLNSALFIFGGVNNGGWFSTNTISWSALPASPDAATGVAHSRTIQYGQYLVWMGGTVGSDGLRYWAIANVSITTPSTVIFNWLGSSSSAGNVLPAWLGRSAFGLSTNSAGDRLILCGGMRNNVDSLNDCWISNSAPGMNALNTWTLLPTAPWSRRGFVALIQSRAYLYLLFGTNDNYPGPLADRKYLNEVWVSPDDGFTWLLVGQANIAPRLMINSATALVNGPSAVFIVGGQKASGIEYCNDVYLGYF